MAHLPPIPYSTIGGILGWVVLGYGFFNFKISKSRGFLIHLGFTLVHIWFLSYWNFFTWANSIGLVLFPFHWLILSGLITT